MLEVSLDTSPLALSRTGTARYLNGLRTGLRLGDDVRVREHAFSIPGRAAVPVRDVAWYLAALPLLARRSDVLHCPTFRAPIAAPVPLVVTVFDLAVLREPKFFNRWSRSYSRQLLPRVVAAADRLIAISEFTAQELVDLLHVAEKKVRVVPVAVGEPFTADGDAAAGDYVLAVATLEPRKNLARLVEAFRRSQLNGTELRIVGPRGWGDVEPVEAANVRWLGEVSDDELARLYRGARCAAYVSLYEGFGLPVLEAMATGTAVVASDIPPIRALGPGVLRVDPRDPDAIAQGLVDAIAERDRLGAAGRTAAGAYDWRRVAAETTAVYRELAA
jgi:alpha-1,3-rhamnosyl/mannosyltransferase